MRCVCWRGAGAWIGVLFLVNGAGCAPRTMTDVVVMGMIHDGHVISESYGIERVKSLIRAIDPDAILCEIPPDRLGAALDEFEQTGEVTEARVARFPEYVSALFPLTREMDFEIVPCAAWTADMASDRRAKLAALKTERPADWEEMTRSEDWADARLAAEGLDDDPWKIHTPRYDAIVQRGLEPYDRLFNDILGPGGWTNINRAHYALISEALDRRRDSGERILIMFGAWHKYWILDRLMEREDVVVRSLAECLGAGD